MKHRAGFLVSLALPLLALASSTQAQSIPKKYFSANTTNSTLVYASKGLLKTGVVINTTSTIYYLKLYDKATAPTCGTDTPVWTLPVPFGNSGAGGGFVLPLADGLQFANGIGFCLTGALADNDTTVAATGIVIDLGVSGH